MASLWPYRDIYDMKLVKRSTFWNTQTSCLAVITIVRRTEVNPTWFVSFSAFQAPAHLNVVLEFGVELEEAAPKFVICPPPLQIKQTHF